MVYFHQRKATTNIIYNTRRAQTKTKKINKNISNIIYDNINKNKINIKTKAKKIITTATNNNT